MNKLEKTIEGCKSITGKSGEKYCPFPFDCSKGRTCQYQGDDTLVHTSGSSPSFHILYECEKANS